MEKEKFEKLLNNTKKAFEDVTAELISSEFSPCATIVPDNNKIVVIIGMSGRSKGRIHLECNMTTAEKFTVAMNDGEQLEEKNDLYIYIAEFANMICGRAATYINNEFNEREVWLSPPAIFSGENLEITTPSIHSEKVYYSGEPGNFLVDVGFEGGN